MDSSLNWTQLREDTLKLKRGQQKLSKLKDEEKKKNE